MSKKHAFHAFFIFIFAIFALPQDVQAIWGRCFKATFAHKKSVAVSNHGSGNVCVDYEHNDNRITDNSITHHHYYYYGAIAAKAAVETCDSSTQTDDEPKRFITPTRKPKTPWWFPSTFSSLFRRAPSPRVLPLEEPLAKPRSSSASESTAMSILAKSDGSKDDADSISTLDLSNFSDIQISGHAEDSDSVSPLTPSEWSRSRDARTSKPRDRTAHKTARRALFESQVPFECDESAILPIDADSDESIQTRAAHIKKILLQIERIDARNAETALEKLYKEAASSSAKYTEFDKQELHKALAAIYARMPIDEIKAQLREAYLAHKATLV